MAFLIRPEILGTGSFPSDVMLWGGGVHLHVDVRVHVRAHTEI